MKSPDLNADQARQLCYSILTDAQKSRFEATKELDFSFGIKSMARFRANLFFQRGAVSGVLAATIAAMRRLGAEPSRIVAAIGPTISLANYEVGPDFAASLLETHRDAGNRISVPEGGRAHFDLPGFVFDQLIEAGAGKVNDLGRCTYGNPKHYFSHRRATHQAARTGRQVSMIGLI